MALTIACPACRQPYQVLQQSLGSRARCKKCGETFTLVLSADETHAHGTPPPPQPVVITEMTVPEELPKKLGRFEIRARLGSGAFGMVYRAYDPYLDRDVALKVPHAAALLDEDARARMLREPKAAARLKHPHIVAVHEAGFDQGQYYIASDFIEGQTLQEAIRRGPLDFRRAVEIVAKLAQALQYAHEQGIVHRDVKPANIMLDCQGQPHLMDFGLARREQLDEQLTADGSLLGTPAYMSPEQAGAGDAKVGPASDQYSLGVVLYELLCGRPPFNGAPLVVMYELREKSPPPPRELNPNIPPALEAICRKAMAKRSLERYASAGDFAGELLAFLNQPPAARSSTSRANGKTSIDSFAIPPVVDEGRRVGSRPTRVASRTASPRKVWIAAAVGAVALLAGVLVYINTRSGMVRIELNDPTGQVAIRVDGDTIDIAGLKDPLTMKVGQHDLEVTSADFKTFTKRFTVTRGNLAIVDVQLEPKDTPVAVASPAPTPPVVPNTPTAPTPPVVTPPLDDAAKRAAEAAAAQAAAAKAAEELAASAGGAPAKTAAECAPGRATIAAQHQLTVHHQFARDEADSNSGRGVPDGLAGQRPRSGRR